MKRKLIVTFLLLILLPLMVLSLFVVDRSERMALENANTATQRSLEQAGREISNMTGMIAYASDMLYQDPVLRHYVGDTQEELTGMLSDVETLRSVMSNNESSLRLHRIRLYIRKEKMAAREKVHFFSVDDISATDWYETVARDTGLGSWSGAYFDRSMVDANPCWLISYRRIVRSANALYANDGLLSMDLAEQELYSHISAIPSRTGECVYLLDPTGKVLSAGDKTLLGTALLPDTTLTGSGKLEREVNGEKRTLIYTTLEGTGWVLVDAISSRHILENYSYWDDIKLVVYVAVTLAVFAGASYFVIHIFNQELARRITAVARRLEDNTQHPQDENRRESDLDKAERLVLEVLENNRKLTEDNYRVRLQERKAQLLALQAQINPHFLYNTLECINWMAFQHGADDISQAITALARYFRLSLSDGKDVVSIADEIELARTYLAIQNIRFESMIETDIQAPEELRQYAIPKLILQPFVENAVLHGIRKLPQRAGRITIRGEIQEDCILLSVADNGIGMTEAELREVSRPTKQKDHYGLYNVRERIRLYYGDGYGVTLRSKEGEGTEVTIRIGKRVWEDPEA